MGVGRVRNSRHHAAVWLYEFRSADRPPDQWSSVRRIDDAGPGACLRASDGVAHEASKPRRCCMRMILAVALAVTGFAETYRFPPTEFYNTFLGANNPVHRITPGDHALT